MFGYSDAEKRPQSSPLWLGLDSDFCDRPDVESFAGQEANRVPSGLMMPEADPSCPGCRAVEGEVDLPFEGRSRGGEEGDVIPAGLGLGLTVRVTVRWGWG